MLTNCANMKPQGPLGYHGLRIDAILHCFGVNTDGGRVFAYAQGPPGTQHTKNVNPLEKITILAPFDISWQNLAF